MSAGGAEVEGGDWAEQPRQISKRTRNARRTIINRNHLSMSKRLIISWQEGTLCGHSSCVPPLCRAFCRPLADASPLLQALRVRWLLAIALFVRIVTAKVVVLASLDPGPRRSAKRTVGHRFAINHYLRQQRRFQRGLFQVHGRRLQRIQHVRKSFSSRTD